MKLHSKQDGQVAANNISWAARQRQPCVNGNWLRQKGEFLTPTQNPHPLTDHQKIVVSDYIGDPYGCAKLGANLSTGGLLGKWVKYNKSFIYLFIPFFMNSPTGQTRRRIFTLDGSNDADSRKNVPFGGFVYIAHFAGKIPPKPQSLGVNRRFQAKRKILGG